MTIYSSQMISGMVGQQINMFAGYNGYSQQIGMGQGGQMPQMAPPQMPQLGAMGAMRGGMGGLYGEQSAMRMANFGAGAMGVGAAGLGVLGSFSPIPLDPFSGAMMGARFGAGGMAMGAMGGAVAGLPLFAATQAAQVYGGAFRGGMQDQAALNSTLRSNFQFMGGQGQGNRGFSQGQMGQIGSQISGELRHSPFSSAQEMTSLVQGGADAGMMSGVRDVQQFTQRFRTMLNTLRDVQRELGGTLTDALQFVRGAQQAGIFRGHDQQNFAAEIRSTEAVTGMDRQQLIALSAQGAQVSRSFGGLGRQGAMGALRGASTIGAAISSRVVSQEQLSEATGGLTGSDAIAAFTTNLLQQSGQFSRTGAGRFSLFAMSNADGSGVDQNTVDRFASGDMTVGEISRTAHRRVSRMGRARALNQEGHLRGAVMEQGGMAAQIGIMRQLVGDRVLDQGDDLASLVIQRRLHVDRPQAEVMMSLMRNQGRIAETERADRFSARRSTETATDITENRSFDGFMRHLEHGMSDTMGVTRAREMGRTFLSRISAMAERAMNDVLGVSTGSMGQSSERAMFHMASGTATSADIRNLSQGGGGGGRITSAALFTSTMAQQALHALGMEGGSSTGETLTRMGVRGLRGPNAAQAAYEGVSSIQMAQSGIVGGASRTHLERMEADTDRTTQRVTSAFYRAQASGDPSSFYRMAGGDARATDAFMSRHGMGAAMSAPSLSNVGGGGSVLRDVGHGLLSAFGMGGLNAGIDPAAESRERSLSYLASGGHLGDDLRSQGTARFGDSNRFDIRNYAPGDPRMRRDARSRLHSLMGASGARERLAEVTVSAEAIEGLAGSEDFQNRLGGILGATDERDRMLQIRQLDASSMAEGTRGTEGGRATHSLALQMQRNLREFGDVGSEIRGLRGSSEEQRRAQAERQEGLRRTGAGFSAVAQALEGSTGVLGSLRAGLVSTRGMGGELQRAGIAEQFYRAAETGSEDDVRTAAQGSSQFREQLSMLDPDSAEYHELVSRMGTLTGDQREAGRDIMASASSLHQFTRDASGQGRRGRAGAAETILGGLTGGTLSQMEFHVGTGDRQRTVHGAQGIMAMLGRGGAQGGQVRQQLIDQLTTSGATGDVGALVDQAVGVQASGLSREERETRARRLEGSIRESGIGAAVERRQADDTLANQQRTDPLGVARNRTLDTISSTLIESRTSLNRIAENIGSAPHGEPQ